MLYFIDLANRAHLQLTQQMIGVIGAQFSLFFLFFLQGLPHSCRHLYGLADQVVRVCLSFGVHYHFDHFLNRGHPRPLLIAADGRHV